jgi:hypothetical protein
VGLFRRKSRRDPRDTPRDAGFSFFSVHEAALFRAQVREAFAERGLEVDVYEGSVVDNAGRQFGLGNLAAVCHNDDRGSRVWGELIRRHVRMVLRTIEGPSALDTLPPAQIRAQLYPRVIRGDGLDAENFGYARYVAPGLYELLALDLPESVMMLTDDALGKLGDAGPLRDRAMANLRDLPVEGMETVEDDNGMRFEVVVGDSFYTASRVLALETLVRQATGQQLSENGALVAMPFRHQLAFHVIRDTSVIPSLTGMAVFAATGYEDTPGAISPYVYWWRGGTFTQLSHEAEDGDGLQVVIDEDFQELLERLVADGPDGPAGPGRPGSGAG